MTASVIHGVAGILASVLGQNMRTLGAVVPAMAFTGPVLVHGNGSAAPQGE
ncbi:hypothetical protein [Glutamicibacter sp. NPDC087344]|uniref:hypothetical protein n=1 Tax=Glutamicibacter sp. NPDC087344 TaxID=3363994 RepID=UPI003827CC84